MLPCMPGLRVSATRKVFAYTDVCVNRSNPTLFFFHPPLFFLIRVTQTFILGAQYPYFNEPGVELDFGHPGAMDRARTSPNGG